jgi:hypothetical protein
LFLIERCGIEWIYRVGPMIGTSLGLGINKFTWLKHLEVEVAELYHFEHDPYRVFSQVKETAKEE